MSIVQPRSFYSRRGRVSPRHRNAVAALYPRWGVPAAPVDFAGIYGRTADVVVEIGSGMGHATARMAMDDPDRDYLAVEVHTPGIGNLLSMIDENTIDNLRVYDGDAVRFLDDYIEDGVLAEIRVFFPDPWPKARHHKRRIIRPEFVALMRSKLRVGGLLQCATDWAHYGEVMFDVLSADPGLRNRHRRQAPRPSWRPVTKFEQRAIDEGRDVVDYSFEKITQD